MSKSARLHPSVRARRALVVKRGDIESQPRPLGGTFARATLLPFPVPRILSGLFAVFCANTTDRVISITYDDGPHPEHTPQILDVLARHGATATFFVLANQAVRHPELIRRIIDEGHELALHGQDHSSLLTMDTSKAISHIHAAQRSVEAISGVPIRLYRPPYGEYTLRQIMAIRNAGFDVVIWSSDARDWVEDGEQETIERALATVFAGSILLLHDNLGDSSTTGSDAASNLDRAHIADVLLNALAVENYRTLTVSELLVRYQQVRSMVRNKVAHR